MRRKKTGTEYSLNTAEVSMWGDRRRVKGPKVPQQQPVVDSRISEHEILKMRGEGEGRP